MVFGEWIVNNLCTTEVSGAVFCGYIVNNLYTTERVRNGFSVGFV